MMVITQERKVTKADLLDLYKKILIGRAELRRMKRDDLVVLTDYEYGSIKAELIGFGMSDDELKMVEEKVNHG